MLLLLTGCILLTFVQSEPLMPGQPGGPWTDEEIEIVREKVCIGTLFKFEFGHVFDGNLVLKGHQNDGLPT